MLLALNWSKALTMLMKKDNFQFIKKGGLLRLLPHQIPIYWTSKTGGQSPYLTPTTRLQRKL